jgi:hypothetical protein
LALLKQRLTTLIFCIIAIFSINKAQAEYFVAKGSTNYINQTIINRPDSAGTLEGVVFKISPDAPVAGRWGGFSCSSEPWGGVGVKPRVSVDKGYRFMHESSISIAMT